MKHGIILSLFSGEGNKFAPFRCRKVELRSRIGNDLTRDLVINNAKNTYLQSDQQHEDVENLLNTGDIYWYPQKNFNLPPPQTSTPKKTFWPPTKFDNTCKFNF